MTRTLQMPQRTRPLLLAAQFLLFLSLVCCTDKKKTTTAKQSPAATDSLVQVPEAPNLGAYPTAYSILHEWDEKPLVVVEQQPRFKGGKQALKRFIDKRLHDPKLGYYETDEGQVYLRFVVHKSGKVTDPTIIRGVNPTVDSLAIDLVRQMPDWIPGRQNGQPVDCYMTCPISFRRQ